MVILCQVFAVHSIVDMFGKIHLRNQENVENKDHQFRLCNDNLTECIAKTSKMLSHPPFLLLVKELTGKKGEDILATFSESTTTKQRTSLAKAILAKLPEVKFEKI